MTPVQDDEEVFIVPEYKGMGKAPKIGEVNGGLKLVGYNADFSRPLVVECVCGRQVSVTLRQFKYNRNCGCFDRAIRTAYLIRTRVELLRTWFSYVGEWMDDINDVKSYFLDVLFSGAVPNQTTKRYSKNVIADKRGRLGHTELTPEQQKVLDFMYLIAPTSEYEQWIRRVSEHLLTDYPLWQSIPMLSMEEFEIARKQIPEFDTKTFIELIKFLHDNNEHFYNEKEDFEGNWVETGNGFGSVGGGLEISEHFVCDAGGSTVRLIFRGTQRFSAGETSSEQWERAPVFWKLPEGHVLNVCTDTLGEEGTIYSAEYPGIR